MAHFAELDLNNIVLRVLVVDNSMIKDEQENESEQVGVDFLKSLYGEETIWKQTSYNMRAGIYYYSNGIDKHQDQSKAFRKNYAGIGYTYDSTRNAFINPKPIVPLEDEQYVTFNEFACLWQYSPPQPVIEVTRV